MSLRPCTLLVTRGPAPCGSAERAVAFARAVIAAGGDIIQVFFQGDGVQAANAPELRTAWAELASSVPLRLCVTSAADAGFSTEPGQDGQPVPAPFEIAGLAQLVVAGLDVRTVTF